MRTIEMRNLNDIEESVDVSYMEQDYKFQIGKKGYTYEASIERDCEGNITDNNEYGILFDKVNWDTEDSIASVINNDSYIWVDLDQEVFDADANETFSYYVDVDEFIKNHMFEDKEIDFIKEHEKDGYMEIYVTVTENRVFEEE